MADAEWWVIANETTGRGRAMFMWDGQDQETIDTVRNEGECLIPLSGYVGEPIPQLVIDVVNGVVVPRPSLDDQIDAAVVAAQAATTIAALRKAFVDLADAVRNYEGI